MKSMIDKFIMFSMFVSSMPKAKEFYVDKLGLKAVKDFRRDDDNWWVSITAPEGGANITLTTYKSKMMPGTMTLYFATSDIAAARNELEAKGLKPGGIKDDLYGPGSGVKWFNLEDPDGNVVFLADFGVRLD